MGVRTYRGRPVQPPRIHVESGLPSSRFTTVLRSRARDASATACFRPPAGTRGVSARRLLLRSGWLARVAPFPWRQSKRPA